MSYAGYVDSLKINGLAQHLTDNKINSNIFCQFGISFFFKIRKNS